MSKRRDYAVLSLVYFSMPAFLVGVLLLVPDEAPAPDPAPPPAVQPIPPADDEPAAIAAAGDEEPPPPGFTAGWHKDENAVKAFSKTLRVAHFAQTEAGAADDPLPDHAYLWDAYVKLFGGVSPVQNQNPVGSCVGFGTSRAIEKSLCWDIAFNGARYEFKFLVEESVYGGSRHEIGHDRIGGDGSVGAWAAEFATKYGCLPRGAYLGGKYSLLKYSPTLCRQWGRSGVPDDLEPDVKKYPCKSTAQVRTVAEAKRALANGYGIAECSNLLIGSKRDASGRVGLGGRGGHCMCIDGYHVEAGQTYFHIENSWGESYHTGPVGWGSPNTSGGWVTEAVAKSMLGSGDSWTFSSVVGFPKRDLSWAARPVPCCPKPLALRRGFGAPVALAY